MLALCNLTDLRVALEGDIKAGDTTSDALLVSIVRGVSAHFEKYLGRDLQWMARTKTFNARPGAQVISLPAYPIDTAETFELRADYNRAFGDGTIVAPTTYNVEAEIGLVRLDRVSVQAGYGVLRVTWTGGLASNTSELATLHPDLVRACVLQCVHEFRRRATLDNSNQGMGGIAVGWNDQVQMLKSVKDMLRPYECVGGPW